MATLPCLAPRVLARRLVLVRHSVLAPSHGAFERFCGAASREKSKAGIRLPPLPTISEIVRLYKLRARKHLSQNFILDSNVSEKLVSCAGSLKGACVCEVGPGPGGLTRAILTAGAHEVVVIEKDDRFLPGLKLLQDACGGGGATLRIFQGDVLHFDMSRLFTEDLLRPWNGDPPNIHIIGNLPFNVSTPLIIRWLRQMSNHCGAWRYGRVALTLTFQKEVAERIVAPVQHQQRSRLSIMCQNLCDVRIKYMMPAEVFVPAPKVEVALVSFVPHIEPHIAESFEMVEKVVKHVFQYRQKPCRKGLATLYPEQLAGWSEHLLADAGVDPETKPQQLTMRQFGQLCSAYGNHCAQHVQLFGYNFRDPSPAAASGDDGAEQA